MKYLTSIINHSVKESTFPDELKQSKVITAYKNLTLYRRRIRDELVYYCTYQKSLRERERVIYTQTDNFMEKKTENRLRISGNHMAHNII